MVRGLNSLLRNLTAYQKKYLIAEGKGLKVLGERVASSAKVNLTKSGAVDTGTLRVSVRPGIQELKMFGFSQIVVQPVGTNVFYAPYIEFGTKKMTARPYLGKALKEWSGRKGRKILAKYTRRVK